MRDSGIDTIDSVPSGTHFCLFYKVREDLIDMLIPYFKAGLLNDEFCMCITSGLFTTEEFKGRMARAIKGFDDYLTRGQIEIIPFNNWYKIDGVFDRERIIKSWMNKLQKARDLGFNGMRITGDISWLEKSEWKIFLDYERSINDINGLNDMIAMCSYPLDMCDNHDILDIVSTHQFAMIKYNDRWKIIEDQGQKKNRKALHESDEKFRVLSEMSSAAICVYSGDKFVYVNDALEKITGYSKDELFKMKFWGIVHPVHQKMAMERGYARQKGDPELKQYELCLVTRGGETKWAECNAARIVYGGKSAGMATFFEITERKKIENQLEETKARTELYLDLMSHDINNMHQVALGYLEMARDMETDDSRLEFIDKPMEVLQRSARLIKNVSKLQKLNDGLLENGVFDVSRALKDVHLEYGSIPNKPVLLNLNVGEQCNVYANELLYDVFANLVTNAIKHTRDHTEITISLEIAQANGRRQCRVSVEDNGPGVPDDFKEVIFNRILKGSIKAKGMGLGLYLVKSLVESYNGNVWVEDRVPKDHSKGARFVVMLPMAE